MGETRRRWRPKHGWGHGGGSWGAYEHGHEHAYIELICTSIGGIRLHGLVGLAWLRILIHSEVGHAWVQAS